MYSMRKKKKMVKIIIYNIILYTKNFFITLNIALKFIIKYFFRK